MTCFILNPQGMIIIGQHGNDPVTPWGEYQNLNKYLERSYTAPPANLVALTSWKDGAQRIREDKPWRLF